MVSTRNQIQKRGSVLGRLVQNIRAYFILFMTVSFLGWVAETLFFLCCYGGFHDRGFMTLPFCTIYGCSFLLLYFLIGTPSGSGNRLAQRSNRAVRHPLFLYAVISALVVTLLELSTGILFHRVFGLRLWDYSGYRFHFRGYICLEYTLLWGLLLPLCMRFAFVPLKARILSLPEPYARALAGPLALASLTDWSINFLARF